MLQTFRNAWKITDLRKRILFTLLIILLFRLGMQIPLPFIDITSDTIKTWAASQSGTFIGFADFLTGGGVSSGSIFALGVQPYINASIIMQLLAVAIPYLERLRKEGPEGQRKFNKITRIAALCLSLALGGAYYYVLFTIGALKYGAGAQLFSIIFTAVAIILAFAAGSMLVMWLGEQIDGRGIGNGISIIIFAGIVSRYPSTISTLGSEFSLAIAGQDTKTLVWLPIIILLALAAVVMVVILNSAERRIPVQYAKKVVGRKMYGGQSSHIPIKVNMSGVMPIIFASSLATIPSTILTFFNFDQTGTAYKVLLQLSQQGWVYAIIYTLLIIAFNYFYVAITYNPIELANNVKKSNGSIPGIRPGKPTSDFIARVISKITLIGAIFLIVVAVGPIVLANISGIKSISLGGTSLLIVVGVALDTSRSLESFMLMRHHKGFLE